LIQTGENQMQELNNYHAPDGAAGDPEASVEITPVEITRYGETIYLRQVEPDGEVYDILITIPQAQNLVGIIARLILGEEAPGKTIDIPARPALVGLNGGPL
jgi:hypothetical protein